jgi:hypothetical protein
MSPSCHFARVTAKRWSKQRRMQRRCVGGPGGLVSGWGLFSSQGRL